MVFVLLTVACCYTYEYLYTVQPAVTGKQHSWHSLSHVQGAVEIKVLSMLAWLQRCSPTIVSKTYAADIQAELIDCFFCC